MITSAGGRAADGVLPFSPFHQRVLRFSLAAIVLSGVACHDNVTEPPELSPTFSLEKASTNSGDLQRDTVLATIQPLRVIVRANGDVAPGLQVFWLIAADGLTETSTTISDAAGVTSLALTLGPKPTVYTVQATLRKTTSGPSVTFTVTATPGNASVLRIVGGANQTDTVAAQLSAPYAVQATDAYGNHVAGVEVAWAVTGGGGSISSSKSLTGSDGQATVRHTLGPTVGVNEVTAVVPGVSAPVAFRTVGTAGKPAKLLMISGNSQSGETNRPLAADYVVRVTDRYDNPIAGSEIEWSITTGSGSLPSVKSVTGLEGTASIRLTLGPSAGPHVVTATAVEIPGAPPLVFTATGTEPPPPPPPSPPAPPPPSPPPPPPAGPPTSPPSSQRGTLRITVSTSGADIDDAFLAFTQHCRTPDSCTGAGSQTAVHGQSAASLELSAGEYVVWLSQVALNCTVSEHVRVTVSAGAITEVVFHVSCSPAAVIRVTATATGFDVPSQIGVVVNETYVGAFGGAGSVSTVVSAGSHMVRLGVPENCVVAGANPVSVTATPGVTTNVAFSVSCVTNPTLRVTITTTGINLPPSFIVGVDYDDYDPFTYSLSVPANGATSIRLPPGIHVVVFDGVPANCRISSPSYFVVRLSLGTTTDVSFVVECTNDSVTDGFNDIRVNNSSSLDRPSHQGAHHQPAGRGLLAGNPGYRVSPFSRRTSSRAA